MTVTSMPSTAPASGAEEEKKGGKKKLLIIVVLVLALAGAAYWFMFRPKPPEPPKPGEVVTLEPIQVNLEGSHYLRLGMAMQMTDTAAKADGGKALDAAIDLFSGQPLNKVNDPATRRKLKEELTADLKELYDKEVLEVYFTEFVTQ